MAGWYHRLNRYEFEQAPGDGEGQGGLVCCNPWGRKELGHDLVTEQQQLLQLIAFSEFPNYGKGNCGAAKQTELKRKN